MARKATKPQHTEPENESQEHPDDEPGTSVAAAKAAPKTSNRTAKNKTDAIRQAVAAGFDGPQVGSAYIKSEFGMDVTPQHFSAVKSQMKKREATDAPKGKPGRKPRQAVEGYVAPPEKPKAVGQEADLLAAMEAIKPLVAALGTEKVKRIADLLG